MLSLLDKLRNKLNRQNVKIKHSRFRSDINDKRPVRCVKEASDVWRIVYADNTIEELPDLKIAK